jgi:hypothetical protein
MCETLKHDNQRKMASLSSIICAGNTIQAAIMRGPRPLAEEAQTTRHAQDLERKPAAPKDAVD